MQRIEIKNFGPIKNVAFDIKDYTVFIGPQASGKSTIARAVYFFRSLSDELHAAIALSMPDWHTEKIISTFKENIAKKAKIIWDSAFWNSKTTLLFHYGNNVEITISQADNDTLFVSLSIGWNVLFRRAENLLHQTQKELGKKGLILYDMPLSHWVVGMFVESVFPFSQNKPTFIPAGRVLFSSIEESLIPREQKLADVLVARFFDFCGRIKRMYHPKIIQAHRSKKKIDSRVVRKVRSLSKDILCGTVEFKDDKCYLSSPHQKVFVQIVNASSGQQEAVWILLYIMHICYLDVTKMFTVIEEPEAHLFPGAQRDMMYVLTLLANQSGNQLMLTTHSPYILTPLNNLLLAHHIGQNKRKAAEKIVEPDLWIDPDRFECYYVDKGIITSVMDRNTGMMDLAGLDAVSSTLNEQYDQLTELED